MTEDDYSGLFLDGIVKGIVFDESEKHAMMHEFLNRVEDMGAYFGGQAFETTALEEPVNVPALNIQGIIFFEDKDFYQGDFEKILLDNKLKYEGIIHSVKDSDLNEKELDKQ